MSSLIEQEVTRCINQDEELQKYQKKLPEEMDSLYVRQKTDQEVVDTIRIAKNTYKTNKTISLIIVGIGLALLTNSIVAYWYSGNPESNAVLMGGLGMASFVSLFFVRPQKRLSVALGNLTQIEMIHKSHSLQFENIRKYLEKNQIRMGPKEITQINKQLNDLTLKHAWFVQKFIEPCKDDPDKSVSK